MLILFFANRFSILLGDLGLKPEDTIHLVTGNSNMTYPISFGAWALGAIVSLGDINLEPQGVAHQLKESEAKLVFCTPATSDLVRKAVDILGKDNDIRILCLGDAHGLDNILSKLETAEGKSFPAPYNSPDVEREIIQIFWSSGTTGTRQVSLAVMIFPFIKSSNYELS